MQLQEAGCNNSIASKQIKMQNIFMSYLAYGYSGTLCCKIFNASLIEAGRIKILKT